ncbi:fluoride efflux transporter FluC [Plantactinospora soyae]|uniref:Fluoride-specific ion channel FluC n=1 Tax=Plantactinospora soyae TaxID=1544732 RepID=A0A927QVS2_9ACTN|nr:CrcB family protein [Plantactinospora soyae]MBE1486060.1 CrcB protein [Plantactinospora soyae]
MSPSRPRPTEPTGATGAAEPDVPDEPVPPRRPSPPVGRPRWDVIAVVALGGALGSAGRYGLLLLWPHTPDGFPWATLGTNLSGCALIGLLMRLVSTQLAAHRLVQPFFVTGLLGGFTTFSTYAVETRGLFAADRPGLALGYLVGTLAGALVAVRVGIWAADRVRS